MTDRLHVLLVGDTQVATAIRHALSRSGYQPSLARVSDVATIDATARRPGLRLALCAALPELAPAEAVVQVRAAAPCLPVVALVAPADDEAGLAAIAAGARDYVHLDRTARLGAVVVRELAEAERRQREQAENAARLSALNTITAAQQQFLTVYDSVACAIFVQALGGEILHANAAAQALAGLTLEEMRGHLPATLFEFEDQSGRPVMPAESPRVRSLQTANPQRDVTLRVRRPDGEWHWIQFDVVPVCGPDGRPAQIVTSLIDVTGRKDAEDALRLLAGRQAAIARLERAAMWGSDLDTLLRAAVAEVAETLGTELTAVFERQEEPDLYRLRAGRGWPDDAVGTALIRRMTSAGADDPPAVRGASMESPHSENWPLRTPLLREQWVRAGISIEVPLHVRSFGLLGAYTRTERHFDDEEVRFLQTVAHLLGGVVERRQAAADRLVSELRLQSIVETSPDLISVIDPLGRYRFVNSAYQRLLGYPPGSLIGRDGLALLHPDDAGEVASQLDGLLAPAGSIGAIDGPLELTCRMRHADGHYIPVEAKWQLLRDQGGVMVISRDVTERVRAEAVLRESEAKHRLLLSSIPMAVLALAPDFTIVYCNEHYAALVGRPVAELEGQNLQLLFTNLARRPLHEAYQQVLRTGEQGEVETLDQGRYLQTRIYRAPWGILAVTEDVTDRRREEESKRLLMEAGSVLAGSLEFSTTLAGIAELAVPFLADWCAVYMVAEDGTIQRVGLAARGPEEEALVRALQQRPIDPAGSHPVAQVLRTGEAQFTPHVDRVARSATVQDEEYRRQIERLGTHSRMVVPLIARDQRLGALFFGYTAPERCHTLVDLALAEELARRAAMSLDNALLYQELTERKQQLQQLVGRLLLAQEEERRRVAYEVHDSLAQIAAGTHQHLQAFAGRYRPRRPEARATLEQVLTLAQRTVREARRVVAGLRPTVLDDFGLATALRHEVDTLRGEGWEVSFDDGLGAERLAPTVETTLYRVAQEAMTNVRKHAGRARLHLSLRRLEDAVRLEVRDWGRGFDPARLSRNAGPGERVGLPGMQERLALIGGSFQLASRPGHGTRVTAEAPLVPVVRT